MTSRTSGHARVVHIITGLGIGGAETMLAKLLEAEVADGRRRTVEVISLTSAGPMTARIEATGVPVRALELASRRFAGIRALASRLRALKPDVVQCWMYHADLIGGCVAMLAAPQARRLWSIRASFMPSPSPLSTRLAIRLCALLSWFVPHRVISCSSVAARLHRRLGYRGDAIVVIPNGFDLARFVPDHTARDSVRHELGVDAATPLIGCVGRFDPQKDFPTLLRAFVDAARGGSDAHLVLVGKGLSRESPALMALIPGDLRSRVHPLGPRADVPRLTAAFDIATLTSAYGEGFPNVLGEALACGVPCVATDVGDSREIVAADGVVIPIGDAAGIAAAWASLLRRTPKERDDMAARARARAMDAFDIRVVARRYWDEQDDRSGARAREADRPAPTTAT